MDDIEMAHKKQIATFCVNSLKLYTYLHGHFMCYVVCT